MSRSIWAVPKARQAVSGSPSVVMALVSNGKSPSPRIVIGAAQLSPACAQA
jgi:hypothetical protein